MKTSTLLTPAALLFPLALAAQQPDWLVGWSVNWTMNPGMPRHVLATSPGGELMTARLDGVTQPYGSDVFGGAIVHRLDAGTGQPLWSCGMTQKVTVDCGTIDDNGNVYVGGQFMNDLGLCDGSLLANTGAGFNVDLYLMKFDPSGTLLWKRNISVSQPNASMMAALAIDPNGSLWYATSDFTLTRINRVDAAGNDVEQRFIDGGKTIGGMSFDPWGGLYVSGGCDNNAFAFGGITPALPANDPYLMFLCRFKPDGTGDWARFAHDITFQFPVVVADTYGHAYIGGSLMDTTSWGNVPLNGPDWVYATFLAKVDSTGQFLWGVESDPAGGIITGDFDAGVRGCLTVDGAGNPYLTGTVRGSIDWGNGVVSDAISQGLRAQSIVAFDPNGTPQWASTSSPMAFINSHSIAGLSNGTLYFSNHANDVFNFPPHQSGANGVQTFTIGRISSLSTGVAPEHTAVNAIAFPSPFPEGFSIAPRPGPKALLRAMDASGRTVYAGGYRDDLGREWPAGIYAVEVRDGNGRSVVRVVKE